MDTLAQDLRFAIRRLVKQPGFAAITILTLALGLGANTAVFTLVHALMLRSLPVAHPEELYRLGDNDNCCVNSGLQDDYSLFSYRLYEHLRNSLPEFSDLAGFQARLMAIGVRRSGDKVSESLRGQFVSGNYFTTFGVRPAAGRLLQAADDEPGAEPVVVMSGRTWALRYGRDPGVVGATLAINGRPMTVVGVADERFFGDTVRPDPASFWIPISQEPALQGASGSLVDRPASDWLYAIGRLRPGERPEEVSARATVAIQQWLTAQSFVSEDDRADIARQRIPVVPAGGGVALMRMEFSRSLTILFVTSALVLLVACANLANLLLARADRGQAAIRVALGAPAVRLMRQSVTEGVLLSLAGGLAGLLVATSGTRALLALAFPGARFVPVDAAPSPAVLLFALGLAVVTGMVFTAAPAWAMARTRPLAALHGIGRDGQQRSLVPARGLVVAQVALSLVLLASAGLLATSLGNLQGQPLGFDPERRFVVHIDPPVLAGPAEFENMYQRIRERLLQVPGIDDASYAMYSPMEGNNWSSGITINGRPIDPDQPSWSSWNRVGPEYFETLGTRVLRGRSIDERDTAAGRRVAVVNEAFVQQFFESADPIGQRFGIGGASHSTDYEIVGVTEDVKYTAADRPTRQMVFLAGFQTVAYETPLGESIQSRSLLLRTLVVRTTPGAGSPEPAIRRALAGVDPDLTVVRVVPLATQVSDNFSWDRLMARLTSFYGLLALALASLGLYGVTAHAVARRAKDIGVRMALGADRARIVRATIVSPLVQTGLGLAIGVPLALAAGRAIGAQLYGVGGYDPVVLGIAVVVLVASAALAAALPARRAASVDPAQVLRGE